MTARMTMLGALGAVLMVLAAAAPAAQTTQELEARLKDRYPALLRLKKESKIGETWKGLVAAVEPRFSSDPQIKDLLDQENADRTMLYKILAAELAKEGARPADATPEVVAARNARRNFEKAQDAEFLKVAEHTWIQKKDLDRHRRLLELKKDGKVGETASGWVEAVESRFASDPQVRAIVEQINEARRRRYEQLAQQRQVTVEAVAKEHAEGYFKDARPNDYVKPASGTWTRKGSTSR